MSENIKNSKILKQINVEDLFVFIDLLYRKEIVLNWYNFTISERAKKEFCDDRVEPKHTKKSKEKVLDEIIKVYNEFILEENVDVLYTWLNEIYIKWFIEKAKENDLLFDLSDEIILRELKIIHTILWIYTNFLNSNPDKINDFNYILTSKQLIDLSDIILNHLDILKSNWVKNSNTEITFLIKELFILLLNTKPNEDWTISFNWKNNIQIIDSYFLFWNEFYLDFLTDIDDYIDFSKIKNQKFLSDIEKILNKKLLMKKSNWNLEQELFETNDIVMLLEKINEFKIKYNIKTETKQEQEKNIDETYIELYKNKNKIKDNLLNKIKWQNNIIEKIVNDFLPKLFLWLNKRPLSFIFAWDSWLWKTETWKQIWEELWYKSLHIPMANYTTEHTITSLIWAPPSYVWYEEKTILEKYIIECSEKWKIPVIIFDEIEKWHPSLQKLYLELFDEGKITFLNWNQVDLSKSIIIMTTNLWIDAINKKMIWFGIDTNEDVIEELNKDSILKAISWFFRPEILNRVSETFVFNTLLKTDISLIMDNTIKNKIQSIEKNPIIAKLFWEKLKSIKFSDIKKLLKDETDLNNIENIRQIESLTEKHILNFLEK